MWQKLLPDQKTLYSTADIAHLLNVDASTVKRWADSGRLKCYRTVGGHRRFSMDQIQEFVVSFGLEGIALAGLSAMEKSGTSPS
jgi:excisionase family DNA binding protein